MFACLVVSVMVLVARVDELVRHGLPGAQETHLQFVAHAEFVGVPERNELGGVAEIARPFAAACAPHLNQRLHVLAVALDGLVVRLPGRLPLFDRIDDPVMDQVLVELLGCQGEHPRRRRNADQIGAGGARLEGQQGRIDAVGAPVKDRRVAPGGLRRMGHSVGPDNADVQHAVAGDHVLAVVEVTVDQRDHPGRVRFQEEAVEFQEQGVRAYRGDDGDGEHDERGERDEKASSDSHIVVLTLRVPVPDMQEKRYPPFWPRPARFPVARSAGRGRGRPPC